MGLGWDLEEGERREGEDEQETMEIFGIFLFSEKEDVH